MARVNIDSKVWSDPRVKRLARLCGWGMPQTVGTLAAVWNVAYEAKSALIDAIDVDTAAERDGFAEMLARPEVDLAYSDESKVFLRGVTERIQYLLRQAERGSKGGQQRANTAKREPSGRLAPTKHSPSVGQANAKQTLSTGLAQAKHIPALPLDLDLDLDPAPDLDPDLDQKQRVSAAPPSRSKAKGKGTESELADVRLVLDKLSERSGVSYRGSEKHTSLIVARLRQGVTAWDMRRVIGYCADKLMWQGHPKMHVCLRPETLFGPETIERYLDAARSWAPGPAPDEQPGEPEAPLLRLVSSEERKHNAATLTGPEWEEPPWMTTTSA